MSEVRALALAVMRRWVADPLDPEIGEDFGRLAHALGIPSPALLAAPHGVEPPTSYYDRPAATDWMTTADPCGLCGCAKIWHRHGRCAGDLLHCPCRGWVASVCQDCGTPAAPPLRVLLTPGSGRLLLGPGCYRKRLQLAATGQADADGCPTLPGLEEG